jgi:hypothetical protein
MTYHFQQLQFRSTIGGGIAATFIFPNRYGCSVIQGPSTYGNAEGLYEMAVLGKNGGITYETPITSDVLGYLTPDDVTHYMNEISRLQNECCEQP